MNTCLRLRLLSLLITYMARKSRKPRREFRRRTKGGKRRTTKTRRGSKKRGTRRRRQRGGRLVQSCANESVPQTAEGCRDLVYNFDGSEYMCRNPQWRSRPGARCSEMPASVMFGRKSDRLLSEAGKAARKAKHQAATDLSHREGGVGAVEHEAAPSQPEVHESELASGGAGGGATSSESLSSSAQPGDLGFVTAQLGEEGEGASGGGGGGGAAAAAGATDEPPVVRGSSSGGRSVAMVYLQEMLHSAKSNPALNRKMITAYKQAGRGNFVEARRILDGMERGGGGGDPSALTAAAGGMETAEATSTAGSAAQGLDLPDVPQGLGVGAQLSSRPGQQAFEDESGMSAWSGRKATMGGEEGENVSGFGSALSSSAQKRVPVASGGTPVPPTGKSQEQKQQEAEEMRLALEKQEQAVTEGNADPLRKRVVMVPPAPLPPTVRTAIKGGRRTRRERKKKRKRRTRARTRKR